MLETGHTLTMLTLAITRFDADPDVVTETVGFEPTSVARKGDPSRSGKLLTFNGWWHEADGQRLVDGKQHDDALARILALLRGREDRFARLRMSVQPKHVTIYGGLHVPRNEQCGIWLDPGQMQILAACGVGWGLDLFAGG